ncbi:SO_0444 family Cu/Zn efflux transporter [Vreelandella venusta]|uniref:SO_0444 family Cu/Zn efflux transporter n=1 Tax=Vreelandella venusta TaxID=44935 RepID=UPI00200F23F7|nr:SO_0444 family Cu/Zn efflux transporter [Halomonas venusta]MBR9923946.1 SO_0444 family Cu/Zn efflux transporter [Gammaproteobacteria bacterium]UQI41458.1 SO_0444 family Cu/Zn efflux transporter [Halomonas venusta]
MSLINELLSIALSAAPWLLLGLVIAGLIKALMPEHLLQRWMGGRGLGSILRAAVIGMPLPLCSCGAIPTALALHRGGAGRGPTTSFLISTPGVGVDSMLITSVLLGPLMALARVLGALVTAIVTGILVGFTGQAALPKSTPVSSCCASKGADDGHAHAHATESTGVIAGLKYAFSDLLDDISSWMFAGLLLAGVLVTFVPPETLVGFSGGLLALILMAVIGIPLYICATAATPVAAGLLLAGISPGMALVFLLAGPVTSLATLAILRREFGNQALAVYLGSILLVTVLIGWVFDQGLAMTGWDPVQQANQVQELLPASVEWLALGALVLFSIRPMRKRLLGF